MKQYVYLLFFLFTSFVVSAQTHYESMVTVGGKGGVTLSRIQFNPTVPESMLPGMMVGATFRYIEENHFGLLAELNVEQRGWKEKFEGYDYSFQRKFTYLQIPVMTHIYFGSDKMKGFFNIGPEAAFMLAESTNANFDYKNISAIEGFPTQNRNTDQFNLKVHSKFDYGISAGVGFELQQSIRNSFTVEGRFYYGLRDVFDNHKKDTFSASSGMAIMVTLGYNYRIK